MDAVRTPFDWNDLFMHLDEELRDPDVSYILHPRPPQTRSTTCDPCFILTHALRRAPYRILGRWVMLSSYRLDEVSHSAGYSPSQYLRAFALVAYTRWKTIALNPRLRDFDLFHSEEEGCLFETPRSLAGYVIRINRPHICKACETLYRVMGAELCLADLYESLSIRSSTHR